MESLQSSDTAVLTQIKLNTLHPEVQRDLQSDGLHKRLLGLALVDEGATEARRNAGLLYRLEESSRRVSVLVQSRQPLRLNELPSGYGTYAARDLGPFLSWLQEGRVVRYRIKGNPTAYRSKEVLKKISERGDRRQTNTNSSRRSLFGEEADEWWGRQARRVGLDLVSLMRRDDSALRILANHRKGTRPHLHHFVTFSGEAVVRDAESVRQAVLEGVGRARAYGGGMLSLAPQRP